eukprot:1145971-Pelagomonas_calceolata.AAC.6
MQAVAGCSRRTCLPTQEVCCRSGCCPRGSGTPGKRENVPKWAVGVQGGRAETQHAEQLSIKQPFPSSAQGFVAIQQKSDEQRVLSQKQGSCTLAGKKPCITHTHTHQRP